MIIEFVVQNFRSIKKEQLFSMSAVKLGNEHPGHVFSPQNEKRIKLLRSAVIYGANASGKSNLILALQAMKEYVVNSVKLMERTDIPYYQPFKLDKAYLNCPVTFELEFLGNDGIRYNYKISFNRKAVETEKLVFYPEKREVLLFSRTYNDIRTGPRLKRGRTYIKDKFPAQQLFLTRAALQGHPQLKTAYHYFKSQLLFHTRRDSIKPITSIKHDELPDRLKHKITEFLKAADTGIHKFDLEAREEKGPSVVVEGEMFHPRHDGEQVETPDSEAYMPVTYHHLYRQTQQSGLTRFNMSEESDGTIKMFKLAREAILALEKGYVLIIDELDSSIHPHLSAFILGLFNKAGSNPNNAQLVCTTHDVTILDPQYLRRDQVWFTSKDRYGASELFSLDEFKRNQLKPTTPYGQWYLDGRFGAVPLLDRKISRLFATPGDKGETHGEK